jgi:hypothetical protein
LIDNVARFLEDCLALTPPLHMHAGSSALSAARSAASKLVYAAGTPEQRNNAYGQASWQPTPGYSGNGSSSSGGGGGSNGGGGAAAVNWGSGGGSSNAAPAAASSSLSASSVGGHGGMGGGADDGAYERGLVAELCVPGGARAVPPSDALAKFLELAPSLDSELVRVWVRVSLGSVDLGKRMQGKE